MTFRISVLISTYNDRRFVAKKLAEIKNQTIFSNAEFIFIETASPERERELLTPFCAMHDNCRLITSDDRKTLYEAWNMGWDAATAPYICYSNMDDCMHPHLLNEVACSMDKNAWDVCTVLIGKQPLEDINKTDMWSIERLSKLELSYRPGPFTAWRTNIGKKVGQFDAQFYSRGDKDFWSRILAYGLTHGIVKKLLYLYSRSEMQLSKSTDSREHRMSDKALILKKPYISKWPFRRFPLYYWLQLQLSLFPHKYCVEIS